MTKKAKSARISYQGLCVNYHSESQKEIDAIRKCFNYFWPSNESADFGDQWDVISERVECLPKLAYTDNSKVPSELFKDQSVEKSHGNGKVICYHKVHGEPCITSFDKNEKLVKFYHTHSLVDYSFIRNLVREPFAAKHRSLGYVAMHASACSIDDSGIIITGQKGAGKSTLLCHLLGCGAQFIGNDAVMCRREESKTISLTAVPQIVRLSQETISGLESPFKHINKIKEHEFVEGKYEFPPFLFDEILPAHTLCPTTDLKLIIVPLIDPSWSDYSLTMQETDVNMSMIKEFLFYENHPYTWSPLFDELNNIKPDQRNFLSTFRSMPKVCFIRYGILDQQKIQSLYNDICDNLKS